MPKLTDEIEYSDADTFKEKVMTVKDCFGKKEDVNKSDIDDVLDESLNEDLSNVMDLLIPPLLINQRY